MNLRPWIKHEAPKEDQLDRSYRNSPALASVEGDLRQLGGVLKKALDDTMEEMIGASGGPMGSPEGMRVTGIRDMMKIPSSARQIAGGADAFMTGILNRPKAELLEMFRRLEQKARDAGDGLAKELEEEKEAR